MRLYERAERIIWRSVEYNKINMVNSNAIQPKKKLTYSFDKKQV